jgi:hypothetical protein
MTKIFADRLFAGGLQDIVGSFGAAANSPMAANQKGTEGRMTMKIFLAPAAALIAVALIAATMVFAPRPAAAKPEFAQATGKPCTFCHSPAPPTLGPPGKAFKAKGYKL